MLNIQGRIPCRACGGRGTIEIDVDIEEFIKIVNEGLSINNKIIAIKAVRERWDMGLKAAKDMVEAYITFTNVVAGSIDASGNRGL